MIYINYVSAKSMYSSPDEMETYKKVLEGDSFEITSYYLSPKSSKSIDRDGESWEYHKHAVFTIKTDTGVTEEFNIDVGYVDYKHRSYYPTAKSESETIPYLKSFGIACKNSTIYFEPIKENKDYIYANAQLLNWLNEKTEYIDSMFKKVSKVQKKKRELEADFKGNLSDEVFEESEIEDYQWHEYNK